MRRWRERKAWKLVTFAALAVLVFAGPAVAAEPSTTTVQAAPSAAVVGQSVVLTATVTCAGDPSGGLGLTFFDGASPLVTVPVGADGTAAFTTGFTSVGAHAITGAYNGNENCGASSSTTTVEVSAAPVSPTTPSDGLCFLCDGLINFTVGDIHNEVHIR